MPPRMNAPFLLPQGFGADQGILLPRRRADSIGFCADPRRDALPAPGLHCAIPGSDRGRLGAEQERDGMGHDHFRDRLRAVRDSARLAGRPGRTASRAGCGRCLVVVLYSGHGLGERVRFLVGRTVFLWRGPGRLLSQSHQGLQRLVWRGRADTSPEPDVGGGAMGRRVHALAGGGGAGCDHLAHEFSSLWRDRFCMGAPLLPMVSRPTAGPGGESGNEDGKWKIEHDRRR
jgi:hypothetical protein